MVFTPTFNKEKKRATVLGRLSYFKGFVKTASVEGGNKKYRTNMLFDPATKEGKASIAIIEKARKFVISETWPGKETGTAFDKFIKALGDRGGFFDGNDNTNEDGEIREHFEDMMYLALSSDKSIKFLDREGNELDVDEREDYFKSGYYAVLYFHFFPIKDKAKGGNGIFANVDALQFFKKGEEFAGGGIDDDEIQNLGDDEDDDDMDDEPKNKGKTKSKSKRPSIDDDDDI